MFLSFPCAYFTAEGESVPTESPVAAVKAADEVVSLYHSMQLEGVVNWRAFKQAVTGYNRIKNRKRDVLTLIDFSKPSTEKRLYVFDMKHRRMLYSSVVSHGKNSGGNYATSFSNEYGSYKSSLGFYLTASTYQGRSGYSLILDGLEKGINDRARERAIVVHGASYADPIRGQSWRTVGTELRMSGTAHFRVAPHYRCNKRGQRHVYLCRNPLLLGSKVLFSIHRMMSS